MPFKKDPLGCFQQLTFAANIAASMDKPRHQRRQHKPGKMLLAVVVSDLRLSPQVVRTDTPSIKLKSAAHSKQAVFRGQSEAAYQASLKPF